MGNKAILIALLALSALVSAWLWLTPEAMTMEMSLSVGNYVGVNLNTTQLTFGTVPPTGASQRDVAISNTADYDKAALFTVEGDMSRFVRPPAETVVKAHSNIFVPVKAEVPAGTEYGNYTGKLRIFLRRAI
jgi:hypothetical protein